MGFTTPCFIRKSTYKLRKKLDELGYRLFGAELNEDLCIFTSPECGLYNIEFFNNIPHPDETDSVDCGTNEELFLAIAALKDDTDNNQLFTNGKGDWGIYRDGSDGGLSGMDFYGMPNDFEIDNYHKATVDELIEHFKTKEEHYDRRTCNIRNSEVAERERDVYRYRISSAIRCPEMAS